MPSYQCVQKHHLAISEFLKVLLAYVYALHFFIQWRSGVCPSVRLSVSGAAFADHSSCFLVVRSCSCFDSIRPPGAQRRPHLPSQHPVLSACPNMSVSEETCRCPCHLPPAFPGLVSACLCHEFAGVRRSSAAGIDAWQSHNRTKQRGAPRCPHDTLSLCGIESSACRYHYIVNQKDDGMFHLYKKQRRRMLPIAKHGTWSAVVRQW